MATERTEGRTHEGLIFLVQLGSDSALIMHGLPIAVAELREKETTRFQWRHESST